MTNDYGTVIPSTTKLQELYDFVIEEKKEAFEAGRKVWPNSGNLGNGDKDQPIYPTFED